MPPKKPQGAAATKFNRIHDPEFLQARKDITPLELACAMGKMDEVVAGIKADDRAILKNNRDGNSLLLLAIANAQVDVAHLLLEMKSNVHQKNSLKLDGLDLAVMESVRTPIAMEVLSQCDYLVTEVFEGPFEKLSKQALIDLLANGQRLARSQLLGKRPDFASLFSRVSEYQKEWVSNMRFAASLVRKGVLLLNDDIEYLERDALLSGALEVPLGRRYLYSPETQTIVKFTAALKGPYESNIEKRLVKTATDGDSMAVQGLLKAKATPNTEDLRGDSVLQCACHNGDTQTIKCLIVARANIDALNKNGFTALHVAACRNQCDAVKVLLQAKADMFARSHKGNSVLDFVKHEGHKSVLQLLQEEREARKEAKAWGAQKFDPSLR